MTHQSTAPTWLTVPACLSVAYNHFVLNTYCVQTYHDMGAVAGAVLGGFLQAPWQPSALLPCTSLSGPSHPRRPQQQQQQQQQAMVVGTPYSWWTLHPSWSGGLGGSCWACWDRCGAWCCRWVGLAWVGIPCCANCFLDGLSCLHTALLHNPSPWYSCQQRMPGCAVC
jgi:hypothetical protein